MSRETTRLNYFALGPLLVGINRYLYTGEILLTKF